METLVTTGQVHVAGEVTTDAYADIPKIVREKILDIGGNDKFVVVGLESIRNDSCECPFILECSLPLMTDRVCQNRLR